MMPEKQVFQIRDRVETAGGINGYVVGVRLNKLPGPPFIWYTVSHWEPTDGESGRNWEMDYRLGELKAYKPE